MEGAAPAHGVLFPAAVGRHSGPAGLQRRDRQFDDQYPCAAAAERGDDGVLSGADAPLQLGADIRGHHQSDP